MEFSSQVAIVTGGARNLGKGIAEEFLAAGATVVIADLSTSCGNDTAKALSVSGKNCIFIPTDVSDEQSVQHLMAETHRRFGSVDVLVNNAGILVPQIKLEETAADYFDKVISVNLKGVFLCMREAVKFMTAQKNGGSIITIASVGGIRAREGMISYAASKGGAIIATQVVAKEFAARGIRANVIAPGPTDAGNNIAPELVDVFLKDVPMKQFGTPEDIGKAAVFLASSAARQITGAVLPVDGGRII